MRRRVRVCLGAMLVVLAACATPAAAEPACGGPRVALLIGNAAYPDNDKPLAEPLGNVRRLEAGLKRLGFDVETGENLTRDQMLNALIRLYGRVTPDAAVVFLFSGYGIQSDGRTFLLPVDVRVWSEHDVRTDGIGLDTIFSEINAKGARRKFAVIDAARRNPFERRFRMSGSAGLAAPSGDTGALVFYSTVPGRSFSEAGGDHSAFVDALVGEIAKPAATAEEALRQTRLDITRAGKGGQVPWISSSLLEDFALAPGDCRRPVAEAPATAQTPDVAAKSISGPRDPATPGPAKPEANVDRPMKEGSQTTQAKSLEAKSLETKVAPKPEPPKPEDPTAASSPPLAEKAPEAAPQPPPDPKPPQAEARLPQPAATPPAEAAPRSIDVAAFQVPVRDEALVGEIRDRLYEQNFDPGTQDGQKLAAAIVGYEKRAGLPQVETPSDGLLASLRRADAPRPWGSIVFGLRARKWGMAWNQATRKAAVARAKARCGAPECTAELSFFGDGCAAFALSPTSWSITSRPSGSAAREAALDDCGKRGKACRIIGAVCADGSGRND